jgi:hypothetical protein
MYSVTLWEHRKLYMQNIIQVSVKGRRSPFAHTPSPPPHENHLSKNENDESPLDVEMASCSFWVFPQNWVPRLPGLDVAELESFRLSKTCTGRKFLALMVRASCSCCWHAGDQGFKSSAGTAFIYLDVHPRRCRHLSCMDVCAVYSTMHFISFIKINIITSILMTISQSLCTDITRNSLEWQWVWLLTFNFHMYPFHGSILGSILIWVQWSGFICTLFIGP